MIKIHINKASLSLPSGSRYGRIPCGSNQGWCHGIVNSTDNPAEVTCRKCLDLIRKFGVKPGVEDLYLDQTSPLNRLRNRASEFMSSQVKGMKTVELEGSHYLVSVDEDLNIENLSRGVNAFQVDINIKKVTLGLRTGN